MTKFLSLAVISMFALGACQTTDMADSESAPTPSSECEATPENPQCGEGGGPGPII